MLDLAFSVCLHTVLGLAFSLSTHNTRPGILSTHNAWPGLFYLCLSTHDARPGLLCLSTHNVRPGLLCLHNARPGLFSLSVYTQSPGLHPLCHDTTAMVDWVLMTNYLPSPSSLKLGRPVQHVFSHSVACFSVERELAFVCYANWPLHCTTSPGANTDCFHLPLDGKQGILNKQAQNHFTANTV